MKFCPNCGAQVEANDKFCTNCGAALNDGAKVQSKKESVERNQERQAKQVQPQPARVARPNLNSNQTPITIENKKFNPKFLIITIVVILAIGGFGFYKYHTSPAHNPNNPLANQTITFKQYDDNFIYLSEGTVNHVMQNVIKKMVAHYHLNPKAAYDITQLNVMDDEDSDKRIKLEKKLRRDTTPAEKKQLGSMAKDGYAMGNADSGNIIKLSPSKNLRNGEKVTLKLNINPRIAAKYGIDLTPRTVKVQGLNN